MLPSPYPSNSEITEALAATGSAFLAPDAHGIMCGFICATAGRNSDWEKLIIGNDPNPAAIDLLRNLYEATYHQMSEFSFEFSLILPSDMEDLNVRTEGLGMWCQGFLTGLGDTRLSLEQEGSQEAVDALNDITEIAQVSFGDIPATDEEETAYYELEEYVRLIALMMFHELRSAPQISTDDDSFLQ
jgi:uncharacterized protein YgfB (UPF0149 family)